MDNQEIKLKCLELALDICKGGGNVATTEDVLLKAKELYSWIIS